MKNRELLPVGARAAPGDLAYVQGFVNMPDVARARTEPDRIRALKGWLVRHGFLSSATPLTRADLRSALSFSRALRGLLRANNGQSPDNDDIKSLNRLAARCNLRLVFQSDGSARMQPAARGIDRALAGLLAIIINAMAAGTWQRLKACREPRCQWVFYDSSKNRSSRWCSMSVCGARTKARAYRRRQASRR